MPHESNHPLIVFRATKFPVKINQISFLMNMQMLNVRSFSIRNRHWIRQSLIYGQSIRRQKHFVENHFVQLAYSAHKSFTHFGQNKVSI